MSDYFEHQRDPSPPDMERERDYWFSLCNSLSEENASLKSQLEQAQGVLKTIEWSACSARESAGGVPSCPCCYGWNPSVQPCGGWSGREFRQGHTPQCKLAAALKRSKE